MTICAYTHRPDNLASSLTLLIGSSLQEYQRRLDSRDTSNTGFSNNNWRRNRLLLGQMFNGMPYYDFIG
jgi:hypothetical protein